MMVSVRVRTTGVAALAVLLAALTGCMAQTVKILPVDGKQRVPVGKGMAWTCVVDAPDPALVTQPMWRDPNGNFIERDLFSTRPPIFVRPTEAKQSTQLIISLITPAMAGTYECIASYTNTPMTASITLDTYAGLTWNNANNNQFATKGTDYKVMCDVSSEPPPDVMWDKDGETIVTGGRYVIHTNGLLIKNIRESDDGTYLCQAVVTNTGELGEKSIKLEVYTAPEMVEHERQVIVKAGGTAVIRCQANGIPAPKYSWIKGSTRQNLAVTPRFSVDRLKGELNFIRIEPDDYGTYICIASNRAGQIETVYEVEVLVPPKIFELQNKTSPEGTDATLECKASGRPAPHMIFRKLSNKEPFIEGLNEDGRTIVEVITRATGDQMQSTGILTITKDLKRSDDGLYECIARSPVPNGGEARKNGHLTVQFRPTFESMPHVPVWTWNGQPVNISCLAEGIPNATVKWRFHDTELADSPHVRIYGSGPFSYITIFPSDRSLYGYYKCIATNPLGEADHTIQLREAHPPGPVSQAQTKVLSATTVEFEIVGPGEDMGPPILAYTTQYKENANFDWTFAKNKTWSVNSPYVVENLEPMHNYNFRFAAVNQVGVGAWGASREILTQKRSAPEVPVWRNNTITDTLIYSQYSDRYEIRWAIPADNGEPIDMYQIEICTIINISGEWRVTNDECEKRELKSHDIAHYEVTGLYPDSRYRLALRAHNALGLSPAASLLVQTAPGVFDDTDDEDSDSGSSGVGGAAGGVRSPKLSSVAIIGLALGGVLLCLIIVDLILFCWKRIGVAASLCTRRVPTHQEDESKLGRDEKEPLKETGEIVMKRNSSVEFDGHRAFATSGGSIIGKNSAV